MMNFTVTRTGDPCAAYNRLYHIPRDAQPNIDFTPQTGSTTFAAGSSTATISIPIFGNGVYNNPSLTFSVNLTGFSEPNNFHTGSGCRCRGGH